MEEFILSNAQILVIKNISNSNNTYKINISKKIEVTYSHVVKIIKQLITLKLVNENKIGRTCYLHLTDKGKKVKEAIILLEDAMRK